MGELTASRGGGIFVCGLWGAGKTTCLEALKSEFDDRMVLWSVKQYELGNREFTRHRPSPRREELRCYYSFLAQSFRGQIQQILRRGGYVIFEVSPPMLASNLDLASRAFYLDTPVHKCVERLAKREGWPHKHAERMIEMQLSLTNELDFSFWQRVERVNSRQLAVELSRLGSARGLMMTKARRNG